MLSNVVKTYGFNVIKSGAGRSLRNPETWWTEAKSGAFFKTHEHLFERWSGQKGIRHYANNTLLPDLVHSLSGGQLPSGTVRDEIIAKLKEKDFRRSEPPWAMMVSVPAHLCDSWCDHKVR